MQKKQFQYPNQYAFTLIEILITVIIIGVLASIALPNFYIAVEKVKSAEGVSLLTAILSAEKRWVFDNSATTYTSALDNLDIGKPGTGAAD